jgi:hypothetical protein
MRKNAKKCEKMQKNAKNAKKCKKCEKMRKNAKNAQKCGDSRPWNFHYVLFISIASFIQISLFNSFEAFQNQSKSPF